MAAKALSDKGAAAASLADEDDVAVAAAVDADVDSADDADIVDDAVCAIATVELNANEPIPSTQANTMARGKRKRRRGSEVEADGGAEPVPTAHRERNRFDAVRGGRLDT